MAVPIWGERLRDHHLNTAIEQQWTSYPRGMDLPTTSFEVTRDGITKWRWLYSIGKIRAAYDAARAGALVNIDELLMFSAEHDKSEPDRSNRSDWDDWQTIATIYPINPMRLDLCF